MVIAPVVVFQSPESIPAPLRGGGVTLPSSDFPPMLLPARWRERCPRGCFSLRFVDWLFSFTLPGPRKVWHVCILNQGCHPVVLTSLPPLPEESTEAISAPQKRGAGEAPASLGKSRERYGWCLLRD